MQPPPVERHRFASIIEARRAYEAGVNITGAIRAAEGLEENPGYAIEIAYDLQSGSYSRGADADVSRWTRYGAAIAQHLVPHVELGESLLDCGTGEMTSLVSILGALDKAGLDVQAAAFDVSWSRVHEGRMFVARHGGRDITSFVGDIASIPLADSSVDVVITVHSLEPNGGRERELLSSLLRVARKRVVLFEPCYERASPDAQRRMAANGYIRGIEGVARDLGARVLSVAEFAVPANPLNPTFVFVIDPGVPNQAPAEPFAFQCPVTGTPLVRGRDAFHAPQAGLVFPIIGGIPVLRPEHAVLASHYDHPG